MELQCEWGVGVDQGLSTDWGFSLDEWLTRLAFQRLWKTVVDKTLKKSKRGNIPKNLPQAQLVLCTRGFGVEGGF